MVVIPLLQWFSYEHNYITVSLTKFSMRLKTLSPIEGIKAAVLSELSKLSERANKCSESQFKLVATESGTEHDDYLQQISVEVRQVLRA